MPLLTELENNREKPGGIDMPLLAELFRPLRSVSFPD
jgi:hypothetical protein